MENIIVLTWLHLIHPSLPALVKQRYGAELRSLTVPSLKPEISQALDSFLVVINSANDAKFSVLLSNNPSNTLNPVDTVKPGADKCMIKTSIANEIGATIQKTTQKVLQADGITQLALIGEVHLTLSLNRLNLLLDALVVDSLDVDVLAWTPFMITNDISLQPSKQEVTI